MSGFKRVALVNVRIESRQRAPVGLLTLAGCIRDLAQVVVFDPDPDDPALEKILAFRPDLIGIGFMTQTRFRAVEIHRILKEKLPEAKVVLGGVGPTVEPEKTWALFQPDALVVGEGEKALMEIVKTGSFEGVAGVYLEGQPFRPGEVFQNLDDLPLPAIDCMPDFHRYLCPPGGIRGKWFASGTPMIMTSRGCPYRCTFCSSHLMFSRRVRRRSVGHVMAEIRQLHDTFGIDAVYFFDDTFNVQREWLEAFCEAVCNEPYTLTWGCQIRVNLFDAKMGKMMRKAGCVQVDIGVESGSPKVLKAIHKDETVEQIERAFAACHEAGIAPMGTFLVGCPEETREDVELTKALIRRIKPSFAEFFYLIPYPGSDLYREAVENRWIVDDSYEGRGMVDRPVMEIHFTREEQEQIRRDYFRMMSWRNLSGYLSPSVLLNVAASVRPGMVAAFWAEFRKKRNLRDAMQAYVHALRNHYAEAAGRRRA
ncbi:MAG: B12-binding domain-containing radical SAM protein [Lentisphaerae bacterium]|nr:B12-binding domain-containing radical SAM protein [Lentisphaerota bacterium]